MGPMSPVDVCDSHTSLAAQLSPCSGALCRPCVGGSDSFVKSFGEVSRDPVGRKGKSINGLCTDIREDCSFQDGRRTTQMTYPVSCGSRGVILPSWGLGHGLGCLQVKPETLRRGPFCGREPAVSHRRDK